MKKYYIIAIAIIALLFYSCGESKYYPRISLESHNYNFGYLPQNEKVVKKINFKNQGNKELVIEQVTSSNINVTVEPRHKKIKPGKECYLTLTLKTSQITGLLNSYVTIYTNGSNEKILVKAIVEVENIREKTVQSLDNLDQSFNLLRVENRKVSSELKHTKVNLNHKIDSLFKEKANNRQIGLKISNQIEASICVDFAEKIVNLKSKFENVDNSSELYFQNLSLLLSNMEESPRLHSKMEKLINETSSEYIVAKNLAQTTVEDLESKYIEMCNYKEMIIIVSTIRDLKEKINELYAIVDDALKLIDELNSFANEGEKIINTSSTL